MSSINPADVGEIIAHLLAALKATSIATAAMVPPPASKKPDEANPEPDINVYIAPGKQYADAREAFAHLRDQIMNPKRDTHNETLDFTYANLAGMLDILRHPLYEHGLLMTQTIGKASGDDPLPFNMVTRFEHIPSNTEIVVKTPMYLLEDKRLNNCQLVGASSTYFKRYGLRDAFGITDGDDDADQSNRKAERRKARAMSSERKCRREMSGRTKAESILNVLVAAGEIRGEVAVEQAKLRNQFLRTPDEIADDIIAGRVPVNATDEQIASEIVKRYGLTDTHWENYYKPDYYRVDFDALIDVRTNKHITSDHASDLVDFFTITASSIAEQNGVTDTIDRTPHSTFTPDDKPTTPEEEIFIEAVSAGHDDEIYEIADHLLYTYMRNGFDPRTARENKNLYRRNWFNACREFYSRSLAEGNFNPDAAAKLNKYVVFTHGDDEVSESMLLAAMQKRADSNAPLFFIPDEELPY